MKLTKMNLTLISSTSSHHVVFSALHTAWLLSELCVLLCTNLQTLAMLLF